MYDAMRRMPAAAFLSRRDSGGSVCTGHNCVAAVVHRCRSTGGAVCVLRSGGPAEIDEKNRPGNPERFFVQSKQRVSNYSSAKYLMVRTI